MRQLTSRRSERAVKLTIFGLVIWPEEIQACWNIQICMYVLYVENKKHYSYIHCLVALTYFLEFKFIRVRRDVPRSIFSSHCDALASNHKHVIGAGRAICYLWCAEFPWRRARIAERRTHFLVSAYEETKTLLHYFTHTTEYMQNFTRKGCIFFSMKSQFHPPICMWTGRANQSGLDFHNGKHMMIFWVLLWKGKNSRCYNTEGIYNNISHDHNSQKHSLLYIFIMAPPRTSLENSLWHCSVALWLVNWLNVRIVCVELILFDIDVSFRSFLSSVQ